MAGPCEDMRELYGGLLPPEAKMLSFTKSGVYFECLSRLNSMTSGHLPLNVILKVAITL